MMKEIRARLVAYVQPPGVTWVSDEGASDLSRIYTLCPEGYRYAVIARHNQYEVVDFYSMNFTAGGWLMPTFGGIYADQDAAIVATALLNQ